MSVCVYRAELTYSEDLFDERSFNIRFTSSSNKQAVEDALRFFEGRKETFKGIMEISDLMCIKVFIETFDTIDARGQLTAPGLRPIFEWKCDWGTKVEQHIEVMR